VLVLNPKLGINSVARLIEYAKARPGQLAFASSGNGAITHLTAERFKRDAGVNLLHVSYKGGIPQTTAIVSGEAGMGFVCSAAALPHVKGGRLTALGVTLLKRSPQFPDVPTMAESIPGFEMGCNTGFFAPGGTPRHIVNRLHAEAMKAAQQPRMQELLATNLAEAAPFTQPQFKEHVAKEVRDWGEVVRATGITLD
jgi:tripartite-type tricarboxylate transporter receptor subunit TctC